MNDPKPFTWKYVANSVLLLPLLFLGCLLGLIATPIRLGYLWGVDIVQKFCDEILERSQKP